MFRKYAERIGWTPEEKDSYKVEETESESIRMLSEAAKEHNIWLIGGKYFKRLYLCSFPDLTELGVDRIDPRTLRRQSLQFFTFLLA